MHAASIYPAKVENLMARDFRLSALSALAQPESGKRKYANGKGEGLLSRIYPGLSPEQAASLVHQKIMVEQLRKVARSRKHRPYDPPTR